VKGKLSNAYYELYCKNLPGIGGKGKKKKLDPIQTHKSGTAGGNTINPPDGIIEKRKRSKVDTTSQMSQTLRDYNKQIKSINESITETKTTIE